MRKGLVHISNSGDILKLQYEETDLVFVQCLKDAFTGGAFSSHFRNSANAFLFVFESGTYVGVNLLQ